MKQRIDLESWNRREHFEFFRAHSDLPFYNVTCNVDIGNLPSLVKAAGVSLYNALSFATIRAMAGIENFRYRVEGGEVWLYDGLDPSMTHIRDGEELFRIVTVEFVDNLRAFDANVRRSVRDSRGYFDLGIEEGRSNFVYISSLPWIRFTAVDHTKSLNRDDAIPRVSWGRFYSEGDTVLIPYNIQVNHLFVDGLHLGRFFETLDDEIRLLAANP